MHARVIVVGFNHHFGYHREGNFEYLYNLSRKHHFEVEEIPEQDIQNESVSSTRIRKAIAEGNIQRANAYLDHYYTLSGFSTLHGKHSADYGMPVFEIRIDDATKLIPPDGVYAVRIRTAATEVRGMLSVSGHAIVNNLLSKRTAIEFHPFEQEEAFNGKPVTIGFHKKIRDSLASQDPMMIGRQLASDKRAVSELIF